ncbi:MAG: alpha-amylase [archaeon]|nr:alpha-amylase [archaeon]MCP8306550.1 alpha-amylase [archaeon]
MTHICFVIDAHQPFRLNRNFPYERVKRIAEGASVMDRYFDGKLNHEVFTKFSKKCYNPTFNILLEMIDSTYESEKPFKASLCLSGLFIEQAIKYEPDLIELLKKLVATKHVEILGGDYYHSLVSVCPGGMSEFIEHVKCHHDLMKKLFRVEPNIFENTELIYNNSVAKVMEKFGYEGILTEGVDDILERKLPTYIYSSPGDKGLKLLFRHYRLTDDLRLRFSKRTWSEFPLTAEKYCDWLSATPGDVILIALEIETFGGYNSEETGIFDFLKELPIEVAKRENLRWSTPTEVIKNIQPSGTIIIPDVRTISCADEKKDMSPWLENSMQRISFDRIFNLRPYIKEINDAGITMVWRLLQQSDHLSYMSTRIDREGEQSHHSYFSSPAEAFAVFDAIHTDFEGKVAIIVQRIKKSKLQRSTPTTGPLPPSPRYTKQ